MSESDWTRPEKDGWHWVRIGREKHYFFPAFYSAEDGIWYVHRPKAPPLEYLPTEISARFSYASIVAPIEEPAP